MTANSSLIENNSPGFPGRWLGGTSMVIGPMLMLSGELFRIQFHFFFPDQLLAFREHSVQITTAYSLFLAGNIVLWPGISFLSQMIARKKPGWALWGGCLVILGLFARTFHYGINHLAFQLVKVQNLDLATKAVSDSYGAFHIVASLSVAIMAGWIVLAIGCYLSGTLGAIRSIALSLMSGLMLGVLKGSSVMSLISITGLCFALVPLGIGIMAEKPVPTARTVVFWIIFLILLLSVMFFLGQAG
jgi:hypothetical protein